MAEEEDRGTGGDTNLSAVGRRNGREKAGSPWTHEAGNYAGLEEINETFSIRFFMGNRKPQFAVTRLQFHVETEISNVSKAFSSVHFYFAKI